MEQSHDCRFFYYKDGKLSEKFLQGPMKIGEKTLTLKGNSLIVSWNGMNFTNTLNVTTNIVIGDGVVTTTRMDENSEMFINCYEKKECLIILGNRVPITILNIDDKKFHIYL